MTANAYLQAGGYLVVLLALAWPLGLYMAKVFEGQPPMFVRWLAPFERGLYRLAGTTPDEDMDWRRYALALLLFNAAGLVAVFALQRLQTWLPLNPQGLANVPADLAFNTAVSFASNTNWQSYSGEVMMSYLTQMLGLTVQNFVSAATGIAVLLALVRGFTRREAAAVGNFWVDLTRATLYVLLPLSLILAVVLVGQGVVQRRSPPTRRSPASKPSATRKRSSARTAHRCSTPEANRRSGRCRPPPKPSRSDRLPRRSRSSSSAPTAAASSA